MMKKLCILLMLMALPIGMLADVSRDSLPSNYGNWVNLTEGYTADRGSNHQKMQVEIDGNTIHLAWLEFTKRPDNTYAIWYRRSTDLGKTWEDAKIIATVRNDQVIDINSNSINRFMAVSNGHIHLAIVNNKTNDDEKSHILYVRSDDGGTTFTSKEVGIQEDRYFWYSGVMISCDGDFVVIGGGRSESSNVYYYTSKDNGQTFSEQVQTLEYNSRTARFYDIQANNGLWSSMTLGSNYDYGYLYITVSDGETMISQNIAPLNSSDNTPYAAPDVMHGGNRSSYNYHPQMVMDGNTIHVMYKGNPCDEEDSNSKHTLYQKSTDRGKTWSNVVVLPESDGTHGTIAAKGQNVYIVTSASGGRRGVYYSHDGGQTWDFQDQCTWTERYANNPVLSYSLVIDPYDQTGQHAYMTGDRYYYMETKDGFKTISKNFVLGGEALEGGPNNYALTVVPDKNGTEHWFLQFQKPYQKEYVEYETSSQDICYRRVESEPEPSGTKALNLKDKNMIDYRVVVPMTPSLTLKQAMTVETWVRFDSLSVFQIAGTSQANSHEASEYNGGWYIKATNWYGYYAYFEAGLRTDKSTDGVGVRIYDPDAFKIYKMKKWHHVALTYDAKAGENNARLYIDGMLIASKTVVGDILVGSNPIALGAASSYGSSGLLDHFAMYDRALPIEELQEHIQQMPTGKEDGCVCLLNFDGTLKDMSGNGNDGVALLDVDFVEHEGIHPPKPDFDAAKDITGRNITMVDNTESGQAVWWFMDKGPDYYSRFVNDTTRHPSLKNLDPGIVAISMAACSDNAYAGITKSVIIGGLSKVEPMMSGQDAGVRLTIQGGYSLTYNNQPKVLLHKNGTVIEGKWMVEDGYDSKNVESADDLAKALFNLSNAEPGVYDVVVENDTLFNAFTVEKSEEPEVWMQVNGWDRQLWNKWKNYSIDYGNKSNVPAYNVPIFIMVSDRKGTVDVSFDFDFELCNPALDDYGQDIAKQLGDHVMAFDEALGDSIQVYSFMIPYIAPNSTGTKTFRIRHRPESTNTREMTRGQKIYPAYQENRDFVDVIFWAEDPWGPFDPDAPNPYEKSGTRAPYTMEQGECVAKELGTALLETAIGFVPGVNCMYAIGKTAYQSATEVEKPWSTFGSNYLSTFFSCCEDLIPGAALAQAAFTLGSLAWGLYSGGAAMKDCLKGKPQKIRVKGVGSYDPNEMIGPYGYDDNAHYIQPIGNMGYTITYENKSTATAPAHEVYVNDKLDLTKYDPESFCFTSFGWADTTIVVGGSYTKNFSRDIKYKVNDQDITVRVSGTFDQETGDANWSMISLDEDGKEIEDPDLGYLLPNNDDHVGEGFVTFSINHKPTPATGSTISNKATIIFDANAPIETNVFTNTFDTDYPTSKITKSEVSGSDLILTIEGNDATSGIASYDLYVFKNGGAAEVLDYGVTDNQYKLPYVSGTSYAFCVIATDHVGWKEAKDVKAEYIHADEKISIKVSAAKQLPYCSDKDLDFKSVTALKAYVATGYDKATGTIWLTRVKDVPANTGVLIMGDAGDYEIPVKDGGSNSYYTNMFKGTLEKITLQTTETIGGKEYTNYYLSNGEQGVGFYKVTKAEGQSLGANRAYLPIPTDIPAVGTAGGTEAIKVSAAGQVPYYSANSLDFTDMPDVKAYTATGYDYKSGTIWLTRVKKVPAMTGILIMADAGDYDVPKTSVASIYENMFMGTLEAMTLYTTLTTDDGKEYTNYYLSNGEQGVGFYKVTKAEGVSLSANRCYLPIPKQSAATRGIDDDPTNINIQTSDDVIALHVFGSAEGTTGIETNNRETLTNNHWYNLQGQRVEKPSKGIYIRNGKMVIIK